MVFICKTRLFVKVMFFIRQVEYPPFYRAKIMKNTRSDWPFK